MADNYRVSIPITDLYRDPSGDQTEALQRAFRVGQSSQSELERQQEGYYL